MLNAHFNSAYTRGCARVGMLLQDQGTLTNVYVSISFLIIQMFGIALMLAQGKEELFIFTTHFTSFATELNRDDF